MTTATRTGTTPDRSTGTRRPRTGHPNGHASGTTPGTVSDPLSDTLSGAGAAGLVAVPADAPVPGGSGMGRPAPVGRSRTGDTGSGSAAPATGRDATGGRAPAPASGRGQPGGSGDASAQGGSVTDAGPDAGRRIRLTRASAIRMRPVHWTWTDRIPAGSITVIPGREGIGKSLTLAWLTAHLTRGTLPGLHHGTPRPVIYAATEDSWSHTIAPRLYAAGADLDLVYQVDVDQDGTVDQLTLPRDCLGLAAEIRRLGVALLAADPLLSLIHASIDTHRDRDLRTALEPLARLADSTGCAVVGLAHFNKSASSDALNLITGSRAFSAVARAVIAIARDTDADDGSCVMSQAKNNLGRLDLPSLRYIVESAEVATDEGPAHVGRLVVTGESDRSVSDILGEASGEDAGRGDRNDAAAWLTAYLTSQGGQAAWAQLRKAAAADGIAERTLQRARVRAGVVNELTGFPARAVWRLNLDHAASPVAPVTPQLRQLRQDPERGATGGTGPHAVTHRHPLASTGPATPTRSDTPEGSAA